MTVTVRKCDFCRKEIITNSCCRTVVVLKSHKDCVHPLSDENYDICVNCVTKILNYLNDNIELEESE